MSLSGRQRSADDGTPRRRNTVVLVVVAAAACVLGAVLAVNALTGGAAGGRADEAVETGDAAPASAAEPPTAGEDVVSFTSPSGNIGCALSSAGARCDVAERSWELPPEPVACEGDWGVGMFVDEETSGMVCATDTVLGAGDPLPYGATVERGVFSCRSSPEGMTCENTDSGRGFTVARSSFSTL